jgi:amino acid transporter
VETGAVYAEEGITEKTVPRATVAAMLFLPVFYLVNAWALPAWTGPDQIVGAAQSAATTGFPLTIIQVYYGDLAFHGSQILMVTSMFISALAFHNVVGRYVHAIAREGVIPGGLARVGLLTGRFAGATAPASLLQSGIAAVVLAVFMVLRADPIQDMFVWLSSGATVGILLMLIGTSVATVAFHRKGGGGRRENVLIRTALPILGAVIGCVLVLTIIGNQSTLLGVTKVWQQWVIPAAVVAWIVAGFGYAALVKARKPAVYAAVGQGRPDVVDDPDMQVGDIRV